MFKIYKRVFVLFSLMLNVCAHSSTHIYFINGAQNKNDTDYQGSEDLRHEDIAYFENVLNFAERCDDNCRVMIFFNRLNKKKFYYYQNGDRKTYRKFKNLNDLEKKLPRPLLTGPSVLTVYGQNDSANSFSVQNIKTALLSLDLDHQKFDLIHISSCRLRERFIERQSLRNFTYHVSYFSSLIVNTAPNTFTALSSGLDEDILSWIKENIFDFYSQNTSPFYAFKLKVVDLENGNTLQWTKND